MLPQAMSIYLSFCLYIYPFIYLSFFLLYIYLFVYLSIYLSSLSIFLYIFLFIPIIFVYLYICLPTLLSILLIHPSRSRRRTNTKILARKTSTGWRSSTWGCCSSLLHSGTAFTPSSTTNTRAGTASSSTPATGSSLPSGSS